MSSTKQDDRLRRMVILHMAQGGMCAHCWEPMGHPAEVRERRKLGGPLRLPDDPSLEHVIPRSRNGSNALGNLLLAHQTCNEDRGTGKLREKAKVMRKRVLGWLELQYGRVPEAWRA